MSFPSRRTYEFFCPLHPSPSQIGNGRPLSILVIPYYNTTWCSILGYYYEGNSQSCDPIMRHGILYTVYGIIPNRSTGRLDKSQGRGYIRFREQGATVTNMIYKRNRLSKLGGAYIGDNTGR